MLDRKRIFDKLSNSLKKKISDACARDKDDGVFKGKRMQPLLCPLGYWSPSVRVARAGEIKFEKQSRLLAAELLEKLICNVYIKRKRGYETHYRIANASITVP